MTYQVPQKATVAVVPAEQYEALKASHERLLAAAKIAVHDESITMRSAMVLGKAIKQAGGE